MKTARDSLAVLSIPQLIALCHGLQWQVQQAELATAAVEAELSKIRKRERAAHETARRESRRAARARGK